MNHRAQFPWKTMAGALVIAMGLDLGLYPRPGQSETCALSPLHGGLAFPVERVESDWACRLQSVIDHYTIVNTVGPIRAALSESLYEYLLDHPPLAAGLIKRLDLGVYTSEYRGPDRFWGDDGEGAKGMVQLVHKEPTSRIYYLEGSYDSWLLPHLTGQAVVFLKMSVVKDSSGIESMDSRMVAYTKLDNRFLSGLASLLRLLLEGRVTAKLRKGVETVNRLGLAMRQHPERVLSEATDSPAFPDSEVVFLKEALESQRNFGNSPRSPAPLP